MIEVVLTALMAAAGVVAAYCKGCDDGVRGMIVMAEDMGWLNDDFYEFVGTPDDEGDGDE